MKVRELNFHIALLEYFEKLEEEVGGWLASEVKGVKKALSKLTNMELKVEGRENVQVNIERHLSGLKIKTKEK